MAQYRYAYNQNGDQVDAESIAGQQVNDTFACIGCGQALTAKVNGKKNRPHFSHKVQVECSGETYLHRLGKAIFLETYQRCLRDKTPFLIRLMFQRYCSRFSPLLMSCGDLGFEINDFDLTEYYQEIRKETQEGAFIPDLTLVSAKHPERLIFIEIAVTHLLDEAKKLSGHRIIEIPIKSEDDLSVIRRALLTQDDARFIGFKSSTKIVDSECKCAQRQYLCFFVFSNGKCWLRQAPLAELHFVATTNSYLVHYDFSAPVESHYLDYKESFGELFRWHLEKAAKKGIKVKNCYLCRYHAENRNALAWQTAKEYISSEPIYCKTYKKPCGSNEAATCERYRT